MNSIMKPKCNPLFAPGSACDSWTQTCSLQMPSATSPEAHGYGEQPSPWGKYTSSSSLPLPCQLSHKPLKPCFSTLKIEKAETKTSVSSKSWTTTDAYATWGGICQLLNSSTDPLIHGNWKGRGRTWYENLTSDICWFCFWSKWPKGRSSCPSMPDGSATANPSGLTVVKINPINELTFWPGRIFRKPQLGAII